MKPTNRSLYRLAAAWGAAALLLTATLLLSDGAPTRAQAPAYTTPSSPQATSPVEPPPFQPAPLYVTPAPIGVQSGADTGIVSATGDLEIVRFQPEERITKGQRPLSSQGIDKPPENERSQAIKPPTDRTAAPKAAYVPPDDGSLIGAQDWNLLLYQGFEYVDPFAGWILEDLSFDGYERLWGDTSYYSQVGLWSAWPAAGGADALNPYTDWYTDNLNSWMEYGPLDLSGMSDVYVSFGLWYDTEPYWDKVKFCASTDFYLYNCVSWSGYSDGWTDQAFWLTSYAGYSQVWLAWVFQSDETFSTGYEGPFVDEIRAWGYSAGAPAPTPTPDPAGLLIQNGSFEETSDHLLYWNPVSSSGLWSTGEGVSVQSIGVVTSTYVDGQYSAYLWQPDGVGKDSLYQTFSVTDATHIVVDYWFAVTTEETVTGRDRFCASLNLGDHTGPIGVDLGCLDATDSGGYWQAFNYTLSASEVELVKGQTVALVFEMDNTGTPADRSAGWVDFVRVYATGGSAGEALDPHEPNDNPSSATPLTCTLAISRTSIGGVIGDALGGSDVDWYVLNNVPPGRLDVDITADTLMPPSELDSVIGLWDSSGSQLLVWNDDDGISYDSYLTYTVGSTGRFYVSVEPYGGNGSPDSFYTMTVQCAGSSGSTSHDGYDVPTPVANTWTVMLYLNAEDPSFASILTQYRQDIEGFIGSKSSFLNVVVLYDGPGSSDTVRYLVQPNGIYTLGTNRWNVGELNMGHPDTLANFVTWAMDQYPAEHYYLAVDDHGDGVYGISYDATSSHDQLTPPELYSALKSATRNGARRIDIFDYEACLMGLAENAYDLREWVEYVVFSEQISWGINTYPRYFSDLAATDTPLQVGRRIVDRYHAEALTTNDGRGYPHTISLIDTGLMVAVRDAVSSLGGALQGTGNPDAVNSARDQSQAFAADMDATHPLRAEYIDLWDLADHLSGLASTPAAAVKAAVQSAVVHERHASGGVGTYTWDHSGVHGLAIYYPVSTSSSAYASYVASSPLYRMSADGDWDAFLQWVLPAGTRRGMFSSRVQAKYGRDEDAFAYRNVLLPLALKNK